jgi:hypothetical protein
MKLGDFECKVSVSSEFATPYLALGDLYIGGVVQVETS